MSVSSRLQNKNLTSRSILSSFRLRIQAPYISSSKETHSLQLANSTISLRIWCSIVRQESTWGRLLITKDHFQKILAFYNVFVAFFDCLHAFGLKNNDDAGFYGGYRHQIHGFESYGEIGVARLDGDV